jgi:two-component system response regulator RegA
MASSLRKRGYRVTTADGAVKALEIASRTSFEWAIVDLRMPRCSGLDLIGALKEKMQYVRILVLTGYGSVASAVDAMRLGAYNYLRKPADSDDVIGALTAATPRSTPATLWPVSLAHVEWEHIQRVLVDSGGNRTVAARRLGIERRTLQLKLKRRLQSE